MPMDLGPTCPLVSVIVPTYNRAALITTALGSILAQSFTDLEILVIDDGSTDDTEQVVRRLRDRRLRYHRLPTNRGQAAARNEGLRHARGEFFAFLDSDDRWMPGKLESFMSVFRHTPSEVACVYSDMQRFSADGRVTYHRSPLVRRGRWIDRKTRWYQVHRLGIQATIIRRGSVEAVGGFDEALRSLEDMELFMRLAMAWEFVHIAEPLTQYVETDGVSKNMRELWRARRRLLRRHGPAILRESPGFVVMEGLRLLRHRFLT